MTETALINDARIKLSHGDVRLMRNNVGTLQDRQGRYVSYGLAIGSSDLIGFKSILITPTMVGSRVAVFVALEGKTPIGRPTAEQKSFLALVKQMGGKAGIFRSVEEAKEILK